jgi:hypothetical protein
MRALDDATRRRLEKLLDLRRPIWKHGQCGSDGWRIILIHTAVAGIESVDLVPADLKEWLGCPTSTAYATFNRLKSTPLFIADEPTQVHWHYLFEYELEEPDATRNDDTTLREQKEQINWQRHMQKWRDEHGLDGAVAESAAG